MITVGYYPSGIDRFEAMRATGKVYPEGQEAQILRAHLGPAPARVAEQFGLGTGALVISRRRLTTDGGAIVACSTSYFDGKYEEIAPRLFERKRLPGGTLAYLESVADVRAVHARDEVWAELADEWTVEDLGIQEGSAVLRARNWWSTVDGVVLEYGESVTLPGMRKVYKRSSSSAT